MIHDRHIYAAPSRGRWGFAVRSFARLAAIATTVICFWCACSQQKDGSSLPVQGSEPSEAPGFTLDTMRHVEPGERKPVLPALEIVAPKAGLKVGRGTPFECVVRVTLGPGGKLPTKVGVIVRDSRGAERSPVDARPLRKESETQFLLSCRLKPPPRKGSAAVSAEAVYYLSIKKEGSSTEDLDFARTRSKEVPIVIQ